LLGIYGIFKNTKFSIKIDVADFNLLFLIPNYAHRISAEPQKEVLIEATAHNKSFILFTALQGNFRLRASISHHGNISESVDRTFFVL
jgi:hypothetical protein